jgi:hypothetical protein
MGDAHPLDVPLDAAPGTRVMFHGIGGYPADQEQAHSMLEVGETYTLASISVGGWVSYLRLEGIRGSFNTVLFSPATPTGER